jgi:hypothetical protein
MTERQDYGVLFIATTMIITMTATAVVAILISDEPFSTRPLPVLLSG